MPVAPVGFGSAEGTPPHEAQEPIETTAAALEATSFRRSSPLSGESEEVAIVFGWYRTFADENELARVGFDGIVQRLLRLIARGCHERFVVIERDDVEDEVGNIGSGGTEQGFRASRAVLEVQPDE